MIKGLIFDCWGTLFTNSQSPHPFSIFAQRLGYEITDRPFLKLFERHMMANSGAITDNIVNLLNTLNIDVEESLIHDLNDVMMSSIDTQTIYEDTSSTLSSVKEQYRLILLSNSFKEGFTHLRNKYSIDEWFELVVLSCEEGLMKPDVRLYDKILQTTGLKSNEIVMIGDNYDDDIQAAHEAGIQGVLIDRRNRYPEVKERKINTLTQLEQLLANNTY